MRAVLLLAMTILAAGCGMTSDRDPPANVRFDVRGFTTKASETEYATSFTHAGTIVAMGDSLAARQPYLVLVEAKYLSGGDPEIPHESTTTGIFVVRDGVGEFAFDGGYRRKKTTYQAAETWMPGKYELHVVGYMPLRPTSSNMARN